MHHYLFRLGALLNGMLRMRLLLLFALVGLTSLPSFGAVWVVTYPQSPVKNDERITYPLSLLDLALSKTSVRYEIRPSSSILRQSRALKRLEENLEINIMWTMTDLQREEDLLPIRIPINKGLIGWRLLLTKDKSSFLHTPIESLDDLLAFEPVQGIAWPDTKIMQANGFNVRVARDYIEARNLLAEGGADFFPRAITEVYRELESEGADSSLVIKPKIAIRYPAAVYFFVNKRNKTLARLIETGLQKAIEDGSFDEHFYNFYGGTLQLLESADFKYFELENQLLPVQTPVFDEKLWFTPR